METSPVEPAPDARPAVDDAVVEACRPDRRIDDSAFSWRRFSGYEGLYYWVLGVNKVRQKVDLYFRLLPGARCPAHRHVGPTDTLVVEGVKRTWEQRDDCWHLDQVRPAGTFASNEGTLDDFARVLASQPTVSPQQSTSS